jgi:hypothetical protein
MKYEIIFRIDFFFYDFPLHFFPIRFYPYFCDYYFFFALTIFFWFHHSTLNRCFSIRFLSMSSCILWGLYCIGKLFWWWEMSTVELRRVFSKLFFILFLNVILVTHLLVSYCQIFFYGLFPIVVYFFNQIIRS